ncbi:MAG: S-methyl-5-thioribose-1-phosphate isomerase [Candidatus Bathyarchaeota archaeon]|nr:S-methyl-5-thioribose-1-phosphate isomerase [Candidatus Bathyarchaeota archaeon]MDI6805256.1 S-methyl-5-thioribose-1-phosphate isomerase [Candidatus Bathyarchaeia archaeon]
MQTRTIEWRDGTVLTIDQSKLPWETVTLEMKSCGDVAEAIKTMKIRGAPLLGAAAAFALALTASHSKRKSKEELIYELEKAAEILKSTRPTGVNLFWAADRILAKARNFSGSAEDLAAFVVEEAKKIADEDVAANRMIGKFGAELIIDGDVVLTHCNAGALATVEYGTALGVIRAAWEQGKKISVIATETRPKLQGARLTTYELKRDGIPVTLITDNMVGYVMYKRMASKVIVGADRIVQDAVINKIGTFTIAVLAKEHDIPFYVAAPKSTFDLAHKSSDVIIEERKPEEVTHIGSLRIAAEGVNALNPAFDITPLDYVTAIICESGILYKKDFDKFK